MAKQDTGASGVPQRKVKAPPTQRGLSIKEIREDAVVLLDGTLRAVLAVSSVNFALKSEEEQHAIVSQYVQFLNTLEYPLEIVIHSRPLDIAPYLARLATLERAQANELLKVQMADYRQFIAEFVTIGEIMTKAFYVVVPYSPFTDKRKGFFARLREAFTPAKLVTLKEEKFRERHAELAQRVAHVQDALTSIGLQSARLDTQALIELLYRLYNPETSPNEKLAEVGKLHIES